MTRLHLLAGFLLGIVTATAIAQGYPAKPVRFIVPAAAGGIHDVVARMVAQKLSEGWNQQIVIDNRAGAGGIIATEMGAKAPADGYTWLMNISAFTTNPHIYRKLPYDTHRDFAPVTLLVSYPLVLVVHPSLPARSVRDLIALAKARPGELNYASPGIGTSPHLAMELFSSMANIKVTHVPYKGGPAGTTAILSGEVSVYFNAITTPLPHIKSGRLRGLGVTGNERDPALPAIPTIAEAGVPGYLVTGWLGLLVPAATPPEVIARVNSEMARVLHLADVKQRLAIEGVEPVGNASQDFGAFLNAELKKWGQVVKDAGVRPE